MSIIKIPRGMFTINPTQEEVNLGQKLLDAVSNNDIISVAAYLADGANPNASNRYQKTALMMAALQGQADIIELLLTAGANPHTRQHGGLNATEMAQINGHKRTVRFIQDTINMQALGWSPERNHFFPQYITEVAKTLIAAQTIKKDGTAWHEDSPFTIVPLELIFEILSKLDPYPSANPKK